MKLLIQRVNHASVTAEGKETGAIGRGLLVFVGVGKDDTRETADRYLKKMLGLRIFQDQEGKTNLSLSQVDGQLLLVSQFTLYASCRRGNRPGFTDAADPGLAEDLYEYMIARAKESVKTVKTGIFGADMRVSLENDGPFTLILDETSFGSPSGKS